MKNSYRRLAVLLICAAAMTMLLLTGCGPKKPTAEDAQNYVKAVIDIMCTGDYDHSVKLADIEEGKETEMRDAAIEEMLDTVTANQPLSDEVKSEFKDVLIKAFGKAKYTVGEATETGEGEYDVVVTIEPLKVYDGVGDKVTAEINDKNAQDPTFFVSMPEEDRFNYIMSSLIKYMDEGLDSPTYSDPVDVTVHYGLIDEENKLYGCDGSEGQLIGEKLFSIEGLE